MLLRDRLPAYISWDQYLANQERLKQNRTLHETQGAPKRGAALLQGLVVCGKCGHRMSTRYKTRQRPAYFCNEYWRSDLQECCGRITAATLDDLVVKELLRALEPAALELSLRAIENVEQERQRLHDQWRQKLERVQHEVGRAERQYHAVEPENRLVARTLEARWEEALKKQRQLEEEYHRFLAKLPATLSASGPRTDSGSVAERPVALERCRDDGRGSQADRALPGRTRGRRGRQSERTQRRDDRLERRANDPTPGGSSSRQVRAVERLPTAHRNG